MKEGRKTQAFGLTNELSSEKTTVSWLEDRQGDWWLLSL